MTDIPKRLIDLLPPEHAEHADITRLVTTKPKHRMIGIGSIRDRQQTPRDRLIGVLDAIYGNSPEARNRIASMMQRVDFFAGSPFGAYDATRAIGEGRYKEAILPGIAAAAPFMDKPIKLITNVMGRRSGGAVRDLEEASGLAAAQTSDDVRDGQLIETYTYPEVDVPPTGIHVTQETKEALGQAEDFGDQGSALGSKSKLETVPNNRSVANTAAQKPSEETSRSITLPNAGNIVPRPAIIRPDTRLVMPRPAIIRPDTRLVMPRPPVIQTMSGPHDWKDEIQFGAPVIPGGRSTPWVVKPGPLWKQPRDSILDYPNGAIVDQYGNVRHDIDGRELIAKLIAGRRRLGEKDVGLTPDDVRWILGELNVPINRVPLDAMTDRALGQYRYHWNSPGEIDLWERLPDDQANVVLGHEFGHVVDRLLRHPRARGLKDELDRIYSENVTGQLNPRHRAHPRDHGTYSVNEYRGEKIAEAIRTQVFDPNTMKSIAPRTAALLRAEINEHPILSKLFQVNGIPVGLLVGAGAAAMIGTPSESQAGQLYTDSDTSLPEMKINLRKIAAALPGPIRRKAIPATLELIARTLLSERTPLSYGGPR